MKFYSYLITGLFLLTSLLGYTQIETPLPSPLATLQQKVGLTDVEITYSRPGMKARVIFGELVPFNEMWRTGANASTKIKFSEDVTFGGEKVPAGEYALYFIPAEGEAEWTVIVHKNLEHWGIGDYKEEEDLVRFMIKPKKMNITAETMTFEFSTFTSQGANLSFYWESTMLSIPIRVNTDETVMAQIAKVMGEPSAGDYRKAAVYYQENGKDLEKALAWITKADMKPEAFWYLHNKATILHELGKKKEAIAAAEKSMEMAKVYEEGDYGYIKRNEELIAKIKKG